MNQKIGIGVLWNLANLFFSRGATTLFILLLAKFLAPEAFGLVAMATVVFELANAFVQSGLGQALIRSKSVSEKDLSTVFFTNLGLSFIAYSILFFSAPYVASFYKQPELTTLVQVMGLVVFINATKVVQLAVLNRAMNFKAQMKANTTASIASGVLAIVSAYYGLGVWSLVIMMLSQSLIASALFWFASSWRPSLIFSFESFQRLFGFGKNLLAEGMFEVAFQNSYVLVIGRFFSAEVTGLYFFAKKISNLISQQLSGAVQQATFPALSTLQDDNEKLRYKYRQIMQLMMFLIAPVMALLGGLAEPLFGLLFSDKWQEAVPYVQLLCIVGILYPMHALNINLLNVKGRSDLVFKLGLIKKAVNLTLLFLAIPYGVLAIAASQVIGSILALVPNTYFSSKLIGYSLAFQLSDAGKPILSGLLASIFTALLLQVTSFTVLIDFVIGFCSILTAFLIITFVLKAEAIIFLSTKFKAFRSN
ncbi:MAG: lipopolysaccharide biosynthesis protein [Idiomarinaceae bacterium]|uniref:lipopolysaccharide biosynthesis protein n=1 Tax=Idiomarina sp. 28-8 TaxID=1260624 RepID=UPI00131445D3|nr:lipopolysaccharide biosynthesis protein [Idiomarina sp. 28-8]NWO01558.1 lipopolysaccharide biosynthesis protein [Idiomarinaceae bacterium]